MQTLFQSFAGAKVDRASGTIPNVSVLTIGTARGHGLEVDGTTLRQVLALASAFPNGLKVRDGHTGGPASSIVGYLDSFRMAPDNTKVLATLHLLKNAAQFDAISELATTMPESFGLSIVFTGDPQKVGNQMMARAVELYACDLVDTPACNPGGLFSARHQTTLAAPITIRVCRFGQMERHSVASLAVRHGVPVETVQAELNSKKITPFKTYPDGTMDFSSEYLNTNRP